MTLATATRAVGATQARILQTLLQSEAALPVERLSRQLSISRNATYQHVTTLERDGFIEKAAVTATGGRPSQTYQLTEKGRGTFPKRYELFAKLLLAHLKAQSGSENFKDTLEELGRTLGEAYADRADALGRDERFAAAAEILRELGYAAELCANGRALQICAYNCVFHELAREHREVCMFDRALLSRLVGEPVELVERVIGDGGKCLFRAVQP